MDGLRRRFRAALRNTGALYHVDGKADLLDVTEWRAVAQVASSPPRRVVIEHFDRPAKCRWQCSCQVFQTERVCAHVWATLLELDDLLHGLVAHELAPAVHAPQAVMAPPDWRLRLHGLDDTPGDPSDVPQICYLVQVADHRLTVRDRGVRIDVRQRTIKKDGQLGALRENDVRAELLPKLPPTDRVLLGLMREDQALQWSPWLRSLDSQPVALQQPWFVTAGLLDKVLGLLATTGRVFRGGDEALAEGLQPLTIDVAKPFRLTVTLAEAAGTVSIGACFERDGLALPLSAAAFAGDVAYLIVDGKLVCLEVGGAGDLAGEIDRHGPIQVPADELPQALATLARIPGAQQFLRHVLDRLPAGVPTGVVDIELPKERDAALPARLRFLYDGGSVGLGDEAPLVAAAGAIVRRDFAAEAQCVEQARAAGVRPMPTPTGLGCERSQLPDLVRILTAQGFRVFAAGRLVRPFLSGQGGVKKVGDWLEVRTQVEFVGRQVGLPELLRVVGAPRGFYELGDGSYGMVPEAWVERIDALRQLGGELTPDGAISVATERVLWLDALLDRHAADFAVDEQLARLRRRLQEVSRLQPLPEPKGFRGELRPYQREGLAWLAFLEEFGLGGCLADEMGLGKTVQVLAHLVKHHAGRKKKPPSLLVAPRSVLPNWLAEAAKFAPGLRVLDFSTPDRWAKLVLSLQRSDLVLTTYALLRTDVPKMLEAGLQFSYAVLDEAQAAKNADSQTSKAVRLLPAERRLALTGTPVENHLGELWTLFEFLNPGMLGKLARFQALFRGDLTDASRVDTREMVQRSLRPVLLRRTKAQVLTDLPPRLETTLWCDLDPSARRRYDHLRKFYREQLLAEDVDFAQKRIVILQALLRLRQAACHEALLDPEHGDDLGAKFEVLLPRLEELAEAGRKALVFSQFTSLLDLLEPELSKRGIAFERLDGQTRNRQERVARFQTDAKVPVFLISLKAGGVGLNLTAAEYVFLLDPWWNPAAELQAIDRAHRIGQQRTVHAYRIVCRNTVEERVLELQANKRQLCEAVLGNDRSLLQDLSREDLELLLG